MSRITERIMAILIIAFLLMYVGYQVRRYYFKPVETETVYEYTVSRSISTRGIAIREEMLLDRVSGEVGSYPVEDAARVGLGETVAVFYQNGRGDQTAQKVREVENEISMLREAQEVPGGNLAAAEVYNREIKGEVASLANMSSSGHYYDISGMRDRLNLLINKKLISTGKEPGYSRRIEQLQKELESISSRNKSEATDKLTAPVSGYFCKTLDGYENLVSTSNITDWQAEDFLEILQRPTPRQNTNRVGRMVLSEKWIFAAPVPVENTDWINELLKKSRLTGAPVKIKLNFDHISQPVQGTLKSMVYEQGDESAVLLVMCDQVSEQLFNLRVSNATLSFQNYSGIRINTANLRFLDDKRGVYVMDDQTVRFKEIDPVYEEAGFVLSETFYVDSEEKRYVRMFDQVIVKGNDLYDGKVIMDY